MRLLQKLGEENARRLFKIQRADTAAQSDYRRAEKYASIDLAEKTAEEIISQNSCFRLKDLAVNGSDILALGLAEGRAVGDVLNALLEEVIDEKLPKEKESLLKRAKELLKTD